MVQLSHPYMTTVKTVALTRWTLDGRIMFLLFNTLSRFVSYSKNEASFHFMQPPSTVILEPRKTKSLTVSIVSPYIYHEVMRPDAMILVFFNVEF